MAFKDDTIRRNTGPLAWAGAFNIETLSGNRVLTGFSARMQALDPAGVTRDVTLHAVSADDAGDFYFIANGADSGSFNLVVKDAGGSTIGTVNHSEGGLFYVDASGAWALFRIFEGKSS